MKIPAGVNVHYEVELAVIMAHPWGAPYSKPPDWVQTEETWVDAIKGYALGTQHWQAELSA